jgi:hypothetical protein
MLNKNTNDGNHDYAVTMMGTDRFSHDAKGNQITRNIRGNSFSLGYDAGNRLLGLAGTATAILYYDGDSNLVKATVGAHPDLPMKLKKVAEWWQPLVNSKFTIQRWGRWFQLLLEN